MGAERKLLTEADPGWEQVASARHAAGHTQRQAEAACGISPGRWHKYEAGIDRMPAWRFTLYLLATDQHPGFRLVRRA